jgi:hypothetical protein
LVRSGVACFSSNRASVIRTKYKPTPNSIAKQLICDIRVILSSIAEPLLHLGEASVRAPTVVTNVQYRYIQYCRFEAYHGP